MDPTSFLFLVGIFTVAFAYASVGHGGASGYLALMAFTGLTAIQSSTLALSMNLVVSAISFIAFGRAKHFDGSLAWPFLVGGVPLAFIGGLTRLSGDVYKIILAAVLAVVALVLIAGKPSESASPTAPRPWPSIAIGATLGWISGLVGIGGGVFLSPLLLLTGWADVKRTAAVSALFIFANSLAGLTARGATGLDTIGEFPMLVAIGATGALIGSGLGARKWSSDLLRRLLGVILIVAVYKLTL